MTELEIIVLANGFDAPANVRRSDEEIQHGLLGLTLERGRLLEPVSKDLSHLVVMYTIYPTLCYNT